MNKPGLPHCLFDNNVEDLAHGLAILSVGDIDLAWVDHVLPLDVNHQIDLAAIQLRLNLELIVFTDDLLLCPNIES